MKVLFCLLLVFNSILLSAQDHTGTLSGKVQDRENLEHLPFVIVILIQDEIELRGTTTNFDGEFLFEQVPAGTYNLKFKSIGYMDLRFEGISIKSEYTVSLPNIKLKEDLEIICDYPVYSIPSFFRKDKTSTGKTFQRDDIQRLASF